MARTGSRCSRLPLSTGGSRMIGGPTPRGRRGHVRSASRAFGTVSSGFTEYHALDPSVLVDEEGRPDDAPVAPAIAGLLSPGAPGVGDRVVRVREQGEPQAILLVERHLLLRLVGRDPHHVHPDPGEVLAMVPHRARLGGASGSVGLR